jgi:hypothetical protein
MKWQENIELIAIALFNLRGEPWTNWFQAAQQPLWKQLVNYLHGQPVPQLTNKERAMIDDMKTYMSRDTEYF